MNLWDVYIQGKNFYKSIGGESFSKTELMYMFEECFGCNKHTLILSKDKSADDKLTEKFLNMITRRVNGEPLQYILGKWYFMGLEFKVGKGVLIPRDDTEVLVRETIKCLSCVSNPKIIDLCSGSGAVAVALDKNLDNAEITAIEISDLAFQYLKANVKNNNSKVKAINGDIILEYKNYKDNYFDAVLSNPPYIPSKDIEYLQEEVKHEPSLALNGGEDGLYFYREICKYWSSKIKGNGILAVEIGMGQSENVQKIFSLSGFKNIISVKDINNIDRVIIGKKA